MSKIKTFRDLIAWERAKTLAVDVYRLTDAWLKAHLFAIGAQMRRSAESVSSNIAEGFGLGTRPLFLKHLKIARGSLCEFESQAEIAQDLGLVHDLPRLLERVGECQRLLQALITSIERSPNPGPARRVATANGARR